jgi:hypothetical protein
MSSTCSSNIGSILTCPSKSGGHGKREAPDGERRTDVSKASRLTPLLFQACLFYRSQTQIQAGKVKRRCLSESDRQTARRSPAVPHVKVGTERVFWLGVAAAIIVTASIVTAAVAMLTKGELLVKELPPRFMWRRVIRQGRAKCFRIDTWLFG